MLRYMYIPANEDIETHINFAVDNKFNQIIHGESKIITDLIEDKNKVQEINIPEYRMLENDFLVFEENESFKVTFIDEFSVDIIDPEYEIDIFRVNDLDLNKKDFLISKKMICSDKYIYEAQFKIESYGEYIFFIKLNNKNNSTSDSIFTDKIIIYKKYDMEQDIDDKFFFPGQ